MEQYTPKPMDTLAVVLPEELVPLVEKLAENVHDVWAQNRINDGWTLGPVRNDELKQHPCLVPYHKLPDSEKEYDRATAIQTLKLILALGFKISK